MKQILSGKLYDTEKAEQIADNYYSDGNNRLSHGRGTVLYRTEKGNFFAYYQTCWQGEHDNLLPLTIKEAKELFESLCGNPKDWPREFGEPEEA